MLNDENRYLTDNGWKEENIIRYVVETVKTDFIHFDNFDFNYPPAADFNPATVAAFRKYLKNKYEYIIIDTTPAGLVADATLMMKYANLNLLICRNNYTRKDVFKNVLNVLTTNRIENFDVIFNDLSMKKSRYGRYNDYYKKM